MNSPRAFPARRWWRTAVRIVAAASCLALLSAAVPDAALNAQASIVPATHSVYGWMEEQRVFGRIPGY